MIKRGKLKVGARRTDESEDFQGDFQAVFTQHVERHKKILADTPQYVGMVERS